MIAFPPQKLKEILLEEGVVEESVFDLALREADRKMQNICDVVVSQGIITEDYLLSIIARSLNVSRVNLGALQINEEVLKLVPEDVAKKRKVIAFGKDESGIVQVAMEDPTDLETIDYLARKIGSPVKPFLASEKELNRGFLLYERQLTQDYKKVIEAAVQESIRQKLKGETEEDWARNVPIVEVVKNLIEYAFSSRASDVHFEVMDEEILVRYRIDGILHEIIRMPKEIHRALVARLKILSSLRVDEHTHPQDGRFRQKVGGGAVDIRVSIIPTFYGEKVELRLLPASQKPYSFAELGMFDSTIKSIENAIGKTFGMLIVCGPTGAGKTSTLYAVLNKINRPEVNIVTIEDPIEYDMKYVNQMQVNVPAGITFASGLRSILRQDPNVIMVGEIRDAETAGIATQSALTGHLVLSSLHTNDSPSAIPRLIDMGIAPFLVAAVVNSVSSQRLVRKIHLDCVESYIPDKDVLKNIEDQFVTLGIPKEQARVPKMFYRGRGCKACGYTGYLGRIGIFEVLDMSEKLRKLVISPEFDLDKLRMTAREEGMVSMFEDGVRKVELGMTTVDEVFRAIQM